MSVKLQIIQILENNKNQYVSGADIAKSLNVSRAAVWKAIKALINEGYKIKGTNNKGYILADDNDIISQAGICKYIAKGKYVFEVFKSIDSTNTYLRNVQASKQEPYIVVAGEQTQGKGRLGRSFFSPSDTGIYMSILLKPKLNAARSTMITAAVAVSVCQALEEIGISDAKIKWVNDIYLQNKKVCGILCEAAYSMENESLDYIIVGIGINVYEPENGFPDDIKNIACSLFKNKQSDIRNKLIALIITKFFNIWDNFDNNSFVSIYKQKSMLINKKISVHSFNGTREALAIDIDDKCALVVKYDDNSVESLSSGEVSIKLRS